MFEIDRAKFGAFVAELRKEKGIKQKELAEKLCISDKAIIIYLICAFVSVVGMFNIYMLQKEVSLLQTIDITPVYMVVALAIGFGAYLWIFIKEKLPAYYDENEISVYVDGLLHMNMPGVVFNNNNWPHIVRALRGWSIFGMIFFPFFYLPLMVIFREYDIFAQLILVLAAVLGGLFIPVYILARKYRYSEEKNRPIRKEKYEKNYINRMYHHHSDCICCNWFDRWTWYN